MSLTFTISDGTATKTYAEAKILSPLKIKDITGKSQNTTLNGNVYIDYVYNKKQITLSLPVMSDSDYATIRGFYDRQFSNNRFPTISITELGISNMVVAMDISDRDIISQCLLTDEIQLTFRETVQP